MQWRKSDENEEENVLSVPDDHSCGNVCVTQGENGHFLISEAYPRRENDHFLTDLGLGNRENGGIFIS